MTDISDFSFDMLEPGARLGESASTEVDPSHTFTILSVCTGNICRSPLAQQLLAVRLAAAGVEATVLSAGTSALVGRSMPEPAAELSVTYGGTPAGHRARQIDENLIEHADLVLTAAREHRADVVQQSVRALRYCFTLRQFARIASALTDDDFASIDSPQALVAVVAAQRGFVPPPENPDDDDVVDPYRQSQDVYDESGTVIDQAVTQIVAAFVRAMKGRVTPHDV
ncbi:low molecular weight phosphatase family protein [Salinibacterium sp. SWN1162]|uniref:arsenate reductase/protein-tyrosine-phosphatase family protein n=1 Tax=Salinibacterium sp. SWN1162 TaxID=2792053 RepID=UPI0018CF93D1|nr:low molecular weight phosphatase family protein [Salinibacterium sp. SWN1162]MBH0008225.1 low molecular weight phosphatase family protein [Salinibacterium sp. SWN1162]